MGESEKKQRYETVGFISVNDRLLRIAVLGSDGKTVEKRCFAFLGDVSELILGIRKSDVRVYKWQDLRRNK